MLSVFTIGTLSFVDTAEAAKWTKFDSGKYKADPGLGYKKTVSYVSYIKGTKDIKMNIYAYKSKNNKKVLFGTLYLSKKGNKIQTYVVEKGKKSKPTYDTVNMSVKNYYFSRMNPVKL